MLRRRNRLFLAIFAFAFGLWQGSLGEAFGQSSAVSFITKDGWKLMGSLYFPKQTSNDLIPGVLLLSEPGWEDRLIFSSYLAQDLTDSGFAALSIDFRGTGGSLGERDLESFSQEDLAGIKLDVRAALEFLSAQAMVDADRIGIVAASWSADYAVLEAAENPQIQALVLISGTLGGTAKKYLKSDHSIPVLGVVGKDDKESFWRMSQVYAASPRHSSDLLVAVGYGAGMFSHTKGLEGKVVQWLDHNLKALGAETEVSFRSKDGWSLQGTLRIPGGEDGNTKVPGVVMVHGAKHDQQTYHFMSQEITKRGMAALRFDWRGKGRSFLEGTAADQDEMWRDVKAAVEFFASQPAVDSSRLGVVAATLAGINTLQASLGDPRIKTVVLLTALGPNDEVRRLLASSDVPLFSIASLEDNNYQRGSLADSTRLVHQLSKSKQSQLLLYDDAGRGSEMLKVKPELQPMILRWLDDKLQGIPPTRLPEE